MAKIIKYDFISDGVRLGVKELTCHTEADYEINLSIAKVEARNGEYTVEGEFDPEPVEPSPDERIAALEAELAATKILLGVE